ncbi:hypothetical protein LZG04_14625 [Saccharothrix sp. S26]|uniref:hypothetical protein n=1 Tax=Saccharothrix sp. S26 TaxID=2907215 RepID=UPI001F1BC450|nr:hypothetical protein [Saccharothrix sp. S26]MCE6996029.1 hypothetical protein [Saccharothrix sp. S26]
MSERDALRADRARARLLEVAGPDLYRRNPFRVTGLRTDAPPREVRARRQLAVGVSALVGTAPQRDERLPLPEDPGPEQVRSAFDELGRGWHRLVGELFWWWGEPGGCGCAEVVHRLHDDAVHAHAAVLDLEAGGEPGNGSKRARLWREAAQAWGFALAHQDFWSHVDHRVRALADRSLDQSTVDAVREAFARALLGPQVALAAARGDAELAGLIGEWRLDADVLADARALAARPLVDRLKALIGEFGDLVEARQFGVTARRAPAELAEAVRRLEVALPHRSNPGTARLREQAAVVLNNCALAMLDQRKPDLLRVKALLAEAERLAVDEQTRRTVRANFESVEDGSASVRVDGIDKMLAGGQYLTVARILGQARKRITNPRERARIDFLLREIRDVRSHRLVGDTSGRSGYAISLALYLVHVSVVALVIGLLDSGSPFAAGVGAAVAAVLPCVTAQRRWFLVGPMTWPKWVGALLVVAGFAVLAVTAPAVGFAPVAISVVAFLATRTVSGTFSRALADRWDER